MKKTLVAFFSASGTTKKIAEMIAEAANADLYEIAPKVLYTKDDLNWMNKKSRSSIEMSDKSIRPEIADSNLDMESYDEIILGFPIWWYVAPTIINTFLEKYDFTITLGGNDAFSQRYAGRIENDLNSISDPAMAKRKY